VQNTEQTQQYTRHDLVKKYVDGETKEQRKARKALEKAQKSAETHENLPQESVDEKYYVLCLKHGTKYSADYVNKLYSMVNRYCSLDIEFVCLTEDPSNLNDNITTIPLPEELKGWWCKPYIFSNELGLKGTILYIDLDVVISGSIDKLFLYNTDRWCTIRDFTRKMRPQWEKYNSSVVRFKYGTMNHFWEGFKQNRLLIERKFHGDQDWLYDATHKSMPACLFPDEWIKSWKWEIRKNKDLRYSMPRGTRKLRIVENVVPPNDCCICVFHGDPNPENCDDPWVRDNWK